MTLRMLQWFSFGTLLAWTSILLLLTVGTLPAVTSVAVAALPVFIATGALFACRARPEPFNMLPYFFGSVFIFFCMNIVLWPVATYSPYEFYSLVSLEIDAQLMGRAACYLGISLSMTMLAYGATASNSAATAAVRPLARPLWQQTDPALARIGLRMMYIALPVVGYRVYLELSYILEVGYLALYSEGLASAQIPSWTLPFNYLFSTGFGLVCAFGVERRRLRAAVMMFVAVALIDGMKGARGALIVPILFCWWFYSSQFDVKFRLGRMVAGGLVALGLFIGVTISRDSATFDGKALQFVLDSVATQGRSLQLTAIYIQEEEEVAKFGNLMVTSNLMIPINVMLHPELRDLPQSIDQVTYSNNLKHILTYTLNPEYYFAGGGTGGVYLIELIESGWALFLALSAGLGWFLAKWPALMRYPYSRFMALQIFAAVFYMPRAEFFPNSLNFLKATLIFIVVVWVAKSLQGVTLRPRELSDFAR